MALNYDLRKLYLDVFAPTEDLNFVIMNDKPLDPEHQLPTHRDRERMVRIWHSHLEELAKEIGFCVEPIMFYEVLEKCSEGWTGRAIQNGKAIDFKAKLDSLGEKDIVLAITNESITFELFRRQNEGQKFRLASAPNVSIDQRGFEADYSRIPLRFKAYSDRIEAAEGVEIVFKGADLEQDYTLYMDLRGITYKYLENGECHSPQRMMNLPSGCANCLPYRGLGGDPRGESRTTGEMAYIAESECVLFKVAKGRITEVLGDGHKAGECRSLIFDPAHPDLVIINKLGIGLNEGCELKEPHVEKEKAWGIHWGFGEAKKFFTVYAEENPIHTDLTFIYPDGRRETVMKDSKHLPEMLGDIFIN